MPQSVEEKNLILERITTRPYGTNAYILTCKRTGECVLIDAPGEAEKISARLEGKKPKFLLLTHSHMDHTGALALLKSRLGLPVAIHPLDAPHLPVPSDIALNEGESVCFGNVSLKVFHTPGHTPGSLCFLAGHHLLSGDTLFPGGPGKTGTPEAFAQIVVSLKAKIFTLPDSVLVHPGHGDSTVLKKEKEAFASFSAREHPAGLCGDVLWNSS